MNDDEKSKNYAIEPIIGKHQFVSSAEFLEY